MLGSPNCGTVGAVRIRKCRPRRSARWRGCPARRPWRWPSQTWMRDALQRPAAAGAAHEAGDHEAAAEVVAQRRVGDVVVRPARVALRRLAVARGLLGGRARLAVRGAVGAARRVCSSAGSPRSPMSLAPVPDGALVTSATTTTTVIPARKAHSARRRRRGRGAARRRHGSPEIAGRRSGSRQQRGQQALGDDAVDGRAPERRERLARRARRSPGSGSSSARAQRAPRGRRRRAAGRARGRAAAPRRGRAPRSSRAGSRRPAPRAGRSRSPRGAGAVTNTRARRSSAR